MQRFLKAIEPPGDARAEWEWLMELLVLVQGKPEPYRTLEGLFNQMAKDVPAFGELTWAALGDNGRRVAL